MLCVARAREPASFWRENVTAVVSSTTSFSDNVVVPFCDQERAQPPSINIKVLTFLGRQKDYEAFWGVYFFENT